MVQFIPYDCILYNILYDKKQKKLLKIQSTNFFKFEISILQSFIFTIDEFQYGHNYLPHTYLNNGRWPARTFVNIYLNTE